MYDYFLGGTENFAVDREAADIILAVSPDARVLARANRDFLGRVVRHLAQSGVRQFLDIGAGLPTQDNVHDVALRNAPDARVAYVDNDPMVLVHATALLADNPSTLVMAGDVRDPLSILCDPDLCRHLDFDEPVAVLLLSVLHFIVDDDEAAWIAAEFAEGLPLGGYLAISHITPGPLSPDTLNYGRAVYERSTSQGLAFRKPEAIAKYFAGFDLLPPGIVPVNDWRPDDPAAQERSRAPDGSVGVGAVGRKTAR
ncbi:SAM-dependent methyltransferase [Streptosporangiaceae bacterium NEAU-GS5]|nr:SAM-dependent methyltransferase [Streptosporangiaceae bacterium NEAU-GS5]